ncbi:hypothetical protein K435DRAFT_686298 [Dendrothele bispora CBS 962.96]|uniref:AB-hydrolase YheT n=1 Tax=Dendrothele bispora (strain CBS 962.96) TaxID=1314807 RepID=A0A4V4HCY1_DENBC|nr:hypothetical protein K435DRAFT_686298 [Dendrothele bispora CBS 962.96]
MGSLWSKTIAGSRQSVIFFPDEPIQVPVRTRFGEGGVERKSLKKLVEERCPSLWKPFKPVWWLYSGHLQTLYCVLGDFSRVDKVVYERTYLRLMDGGTLGLDITPADQSNMPDTTPVLVVLTGLTGGSYEAYIRSILSSACRPTNSQGGGRGGGGGLGYRAVVINFRGCAGVPMTSKQLYSAGYTDDLRVALMYIVKRYPNAPLFGMGFSLGANVLVRYLAEEGERSRLLSGCALGCPWDLTRNNEALENTFIGRNVYSKGMASNLLRVLNKHASRLRSPPPPSPSSSSPIPTTPVKPNPTQDTLVLSALTKALSLHSPTLEQFDDTFTSKAGGAPPILPFPSSKEYYTWASSHYVLPRVRKPLLVINANDDPVVKHVPIGQEEVGNGCTVVVVTGGGGHLGWFEAAGEEEEERGGPTLASDAAGLTRWIKRPVLEWLKMVSEDFDLSSPSPESEETRPRPVYEDPDGWLREAGLEDERIQRDGDVWGPLGCMVIPAHEVEDSEAGDEQDKTVIDGTKAKTGNGVFQGL